MRPGRGVGHDCPPGECPDDGLDEEEELPTLTSEQLERYYVGQIAWRDCALGEGLDLPEPPTMEAFVDDGGEWSVGADISPDDWNRLIVGDGPSEGGVGRACGEPPVPHDFLIGPEALERLYAWHVEVLACLEEEGFPVDTTAPALEEFVESTGMNWSPASDLHRQYGYPVNPAWHRVAARCGTPEEDVWLQPEDFEVGRATLESQYRKNLAVTTCLKEAGFVVLEPPPLEEFVEELGWNWAHADIWGAAYRDNDRDALEAFVDTLDQVCPDAG